MKFALASVVVAIVMAVAGLLAGVRGHLPPGGYVLVGVLAGIGLVLATKVLAALGLQRPAPGSRDV
jgi:hypothetical protein